MDKIGFYVSEKDLVKHDKNEGKNMRVYRFDGEAWFLNGLQVSSDKLPKDIRFL